MTVVHLPAASVQRDGQHDFDFLFGSWHGRHRRLKNPLTGSTEWYEFESDLTARPVLGGKANFDEATLESPLGRIEGFTLRLYDPQTRLWSLYWGTMKNGLALPPNVGAFNDDGVGEFFSEELFAGKPIISRYRWCDITAQSCRWEQAFSIDRGATWEDNWTMDWVRTS